MRQIPFPSGAETVLGLWLRAKRTTSDALLDSDTPFTTCACADLSTVTDSATEPGLSFTASATVASCADFAGAGALAAAPAAPELGAASWVAAPAAKPACFLSPCASPFASRRSGESSGRFVTLRPFMGRDF